MTTTLKPVFEALGYTEEHQQLALVKLLQASGTFGDVSSVLQGVLDDTQAKAVLDHLTFHDTEQAARWLHTATQNTMLRPKGSERYDVVESKALKENHELLARELEKSGMLAQQQPVKQHYDHVLLLGTMEADVDTRLDAIKRLWESGVHFDKIYMLGSDRTLAPGFEPSAGTTGPRNEPVRTEMDMMEARYYAKSADWPPELKNVRIFEIDTFNGKDGQRAHTKETIESWLATNPQAGSVLAISNQPYAHYQDAAVKAVLPASFSVETVAPATDRSVNISVAMDAFARQIDVGYEKLQEKMRSQPHALATPLVELDPANIKVDAATYQFRSGGDANGVTDKGRFHTDRWDPILHGDPILVHERLDGSMYVADGHHRVDLAKRLNAEGKGPGAVYAMVLSEKQGYTAKDVKIIAAYKNLAQGGVDVVDAARVFKEAQSVHQELLPELPMERADLHHAYELSRLPDGALQRVAMGEVSPQMALSVVEQIPDPAAQEHTMRILAERLSKPVRAVTSPVPPASFTERSRAQCPGQPGPVR